MNTMNTKIIILTLNFLYLYSLFIPLLFFKAFLFIIITIIIVLDIIICSIKHNLFCMKSHTLNKYSFHYQKREIIRKLLKCRKK